MQPVVRATLQPYKADPDILYLRHLAITSRPRWSLRRLIITVLALLGR